MDEKKQEPESYAFELLRRLVDIAEKSEFDDSDRSLIYTSLMDLPRAQVVDELGIEPPRKIYSKRHFSRNSLGRKARIKAYRNHLVHGPIGDQLALWDDQKEVREDLNYALIRLVASEFPDLLISALKAVLEQVQETETISNESKRRIIYAIKLLEVTSESPKPPEVDGGVSEVDGGMSDDSGSGERP